MNLKKKKKKKSTKANGSNNGNRPGQSVIFIPAACPHASGSLRAVRYQHTRERQPKRQFTLHEGGCCDILRSSLNGFSVFTLFIRLPRRAFKNASARLGALWDQNCTVDRYIVRSPSIFFLFFFQFLMGSVMDINIFYQYITKFNLINITIKNIAINTGRLWSHPILGQ